MKRTANKAVGKSKKTVIAKRATAAVTPATGFDEVLTLIQAARVQTAAAVNTALIDLYWSIGQHISKKVAQDAWGQGTVTALADYIRRRLPNVRGFSARNLWRMMQFVETYHGVPKLAALLRELSWSHNLAIMARAKRDEEREFYLKMAVQERWSFRQLERQLSGALFERVVLSPVKLSTPLAELHPDAASIFNDSYLVEFLDLPRGHSEADLVDIELKIDRFRPEYLGKLNFYLEALDRDVKKPHENPAIGVLLCATRNEEVVEYAPSRFASPAVITDYQTRLPDKKLLQAKLHEFYQSAKAETLVQGGKSQLRNTEQSARPRRERKK